MTEKVTGFSIADMNYSRSWQVLLHLPQCTFTPLKTTPTLSPSQNHTHLHCSHPVLHIVPKGGHHLPDEVLPILPLPLQSDHEQPDVKMSHHEPGLERVWHGTNWGGGRRRCREERKDKGREVGRRRREEGRIRRMEGGR